MPEVSYKVPEVSYKLPMAFSIKNILNLDDSNQDTNFSSPSKSGSSIESSQQVDSFVVGEHEEVVVTGDQEKSHVRDDCSEELGESCYLASQLAFFLGMAWFL